MDKLTNTDGETLPTTITPQAKVIARGQKEVADVGKDLRRSKMGAPTKLTDALVDEIIERLRAGESLLSIVDDDRMPAPNTIANWCDADPELESRIERARQAGTDYLFDAQLDIAFGGRFSSGDPRYDELRIKAINNVASKRNRAKFGEKMSVDARVINITLDKRETDW